ncbi:MAG: type II toxin-antitoxin system PemK/MazF family toxin [Gammaproteobacteria bacterium]
MTNFERADVVLVRFPFTDQRGTKQRPAVIISNADYQQQRPDAILMAITSQLHSNISFGERRLEHWQHAGLLKPSVFKPIVFTVHQSIIQKRLGTLHPDDQNTLQEVIDSIIG